MCSGGQYFTAFRTAAVDDLATAFSSHAGTKAVVALAFQNAGLECSFHCRITPRDCLWELILPQG